MPDTTTVDPAVAHRAALASAIASTKAEIEQYEKAASVVRNRIAAIEAADLNPIVTAIDEMRRELETTQAAADLAEFRAMAPTEPDRRRIYEHARQEALSAYRGAQSTYSNAPKELVEKAYAAVNEPLQTMSRAIGGKLLSGVVITQEQVEATFLPRLRALRARMLELSGGSSAGIEGPKPISSISG